MIIGITGWIASGKTIVSNILKEQGYFVIDVDKVGKEIVESQKPAYNEVIDYFGKDILLEDGRINRELLGEIVFSDNKKLNKLNQITHKYILDEVKLRLRHLEEGNVKNIVIDAAMLFEIGLDKLVNMVWFVESSQDIRLKRLMNRNGYTLQQAQKRIDSQNFTKNREKSDIIIDNSGTIGELKDKVLKLINA